MSPPFTSRSIRYLSQPARPQLQTCVSYVCCSIANFPWFAAPPPCKQHISNKVSWHQNLVPKLIQINFIIPLSISIPIVMPQSYHCSYPYPFGCFQIHSQPHLNLFRPPCSWLRWRLHMKSMYEAAPILAVWQHPKGPRKRHHCPIRKDTHKIL